MEVTRRIADWQRGTQSDTAGGEVPPFPLDMEAQRRN
jgi:hypothetical protein